MMVNPEIIMGMSHMGHREWWTTEVEIGYVYIMGGYTDTLCMGMDSVCGEFYCYLLLSVERVGQGRLWLPSSSCSTSPRCLAEVPMYRWVGYMATVCKPVPFSLSICSVNALAVKIPPSSLSLSLPLPPPFRESKMWFWSPILCWRRLAMPRLSGTTTPADLSVSLF